MNPIRPYVAAAFPAVAVTTHEEDRFTRSVVDTFPNRQVVTIAASGGLRDARTGQPLEPSMSYNNALAWLAEQPDSILIVLDFQHVIRNAGAYRALKTGFAAYKRLGSIVVLVAPAWTLPAELARDLPVLEFRLPSREQLAAALGAVTESVGETLDPEREAACLDGMAGLTLQEAENAASLAYVERRQFDPARIADEKMLLVKQSGFLEVFPSVSPDQLGGLDALKSYLRDEVLPAQHDEDLRVRGVVLVGVPGTGKSLAAKVAGALTGWPVLRCDISALKGSLVGQSEQQMRAALALAEAVSPCVLFLDEIEKAIGGHASSAQSDGGSLLGMVGTLLTWLQEHRKPILVIATCNDYSKLPAELTRAGRFDERFFVDLPTSSEREQIAEVHLARFGCNVNGFPGVIAGTTDGWTGAEIEQLVKSAARRTSRNISPAAITAAASEIKPISKVRSQEIKALRDWAKSALRMANTLEAPAAGPVRRIGV